MKKYAHKPPGVVLRQPPHAPRWRLSWPVLMLVVSLLVAAWELGAHSHPPAPPVLPKTDVVNHVVQAKPGPWGNLEFTRLTIEVPDQFITISPVEPSRWFFREQSKSQIVELFQSA